MLVVDEKTVVRLYNEAKADRWALPIAHFREALQASTLRRFAGQSPPSREIGLYLSSLHLEDLALACACAHGGDSPWDHFVREYRPVLYRSADAIDPTGAARELADSLFADLYGLEADSVRRRSLFRYFHGRSSLATWLRAVLAQRWVDLVRARKRIDPLPDDLPAVLGGMPIPDPDAPRYAALMQQALAEAISRLSFREAFRLRAYYEQQLTLAQIGRVLGEHEATVSRQLARIREAVRREVDMWLSERGLTGMEIEQCFDAMLEDSGMLDLAKMFRAAELRKIPRRNRSEEDV